MYGYHEEDYIFSHKEGLRLAFVLFDLRAEDNRDTLNRPLEEFAQMYLGVYDSGYNW